MDNTGDSTIEQIGSIVTKLEEFDKSKRSLQSFLAKIENAIRGDVFFDPESLGQAAAILNNLFRDGNLLKQEYESLLKKPLPQKVYEARREVLRFTREQESLLGRRCAEEFLALLAPDRDIQELLEEKQAKLKALLDKSDDKALTPYVNFMMGLGETDPIKQVEYIQKLTSYFGKELIAYALLQRKLDTSKLKRVKISNAKNEKNAALPAKTSKVAKVENDASDFDEEKLNALVKEVGFEFVNAKIYGKFKSNKSPKETKDFKSTKFKNDELSGSFGVETMGILRLLSFVNCISVDMVDSILDIPKDLGLKVAENLYNKGYMRKYGFARLGEFYTASPLFEKVAANQKLADFLKLSKKSGKKITIYDDMTPLYAGTCLAVTKLLAVFEGHKKAYAAKMEFPFDPKDHISINLATGNFFVKSIDNSTVKYAAIGCFWSDNSGIAMFLDFFDTVKEEILDLDFLVLASASKKQVFAAGKLIVEDKGDEWKDGSKLYFYSLLDDEFYIGNFKKVSVERIIEKAFLEAAKPKTTDNLLPLPQKVEKKNNNVALEQEFAQIEKEIGSLSKNENDTEEIALNFEEISTKDETAKVADVAEVIGTVDVAEEHTEEVQEEVEPESVEAEVIEVISEEKIEVQSAAPLLEITQEARLETASKMIISGKIYAATAYLKASEQPGDDYSYLRMAYAENDPMATPVYVSNRIYDIFITKDSLFDEYLMIAASLRAFIFDDDAYDHGLPSLHDSIKQCAVMEEIPALVNLSYELMTFKKDIHKGIDFFADYREKNRLQTEKLAVNVRREASDLYTSVFENPVKEQARLKRFIEMKKILFSKGGDLALYLQAVINDDNSYVSIVEEYLRENLIKDKYPLDKGNIDPDKLDIVIDTAWDDASQNLMVVKKNKELFGSLRNNVKNTLIKIADTLCSWTKCSRALSDVSDDAGRIRYKKVRKKILAFADVSLDALRGKIKTSADVTEKAGVYVLSRVVGELDERLLGTYSEERGRYFYVNFLKDSHIYLTEEYLPDFTITFASDMSILSEIEAHANAKNLMTLEERIGYIFESGGDDFLSAKLIDEYLKEKNGASVIEANHYDTEKSIEYAAKDAAKTLDDFTENLELAQSYGQIDNTKENKKEKILQIVTHWYDYALETNNFGVFKKAKKYWEDKISQDAKAREEFFRREIEAYSKKAANDDELKKRIGRIENAIKDQNYTVAEDMLSRLNRNEPEEEAVFFEKDILNDFLKNYEYYYGKVSRVGDSLANLLKRGNRFNKDAKGGGRLVENWVSGYGRNNEDKIKTLFKTLGFAVDSVKINSAADKIENYSLSILKPLSGHNSNYKHPIAIFGSIAEKVGFRVICLFGRYDADGLIERFKEVGNSKNTITLLDYALSMAERRRLARKIRAEHLEKTYGVIDRVLLVYLIEHYNEMRINQMLMELMMPFASYQPYVWKSSDVMPPEIFMGRKEELGLIESAKGVNIVYGGRQLGKSAMLKMAKINVDRNENGDRAVYIDIKDRNYSEAALKVSQVLIDEGLLPASAETTDWDVLSRAIRKRLNEKKDYIPYFLLLLDEGDAFIASCAEINYRPLDALKDIQSIGVGRFKFVIAGLRDIIRFNKEALDNNNILPHLSAMTVKPFKTAEARSLLEIPLWYLGLRFPKDKESLITLILANTNYFPGLIQLYCAKLIEAMGKSDYAGYNQNETPIYEVREEHIKKVLADETFTNEIKEKFVITLKLGEDQYYYIIALIFAFLYHTKNDTEGYDAMDVIEIAGNYGISKISELTEENVSALLEELRELNILRPLNQSKYLFSRHSFFQMMGSKDDVENELIKFMGE